jgi:hypothetical protein
MSTPEAHHAVEESPATQLGIDTVTPRILERMIDVLADQNIVLTVVGQSGIGKTAIPKQAAARRGVPYAQIHMPTASPESFQLPTLPKDGTPYFDQKIPRTFQPLLDYVAEEKKKHKDGRIPAGRKAILALEELNRAPDKSTTRSAFVLMGDRMIGDVHLDDGIQIIATMNPSGQGFSVNEFEKDAAMRRRSLLTYLVADYADFMGYAESAKFHAEVIGYLRAHVSHFYDETAAKAGKVFACPATWESLSRTCMALQASGEALTSAVARASYSGIIGTAVTETLIEYVRDRTTTVSPDDILYRYGATSDIRGRVRRLLDENRTDRVVDLVTGLVVRVVNLPEADREPDRFAKNLGQFLCDIPPEIAMSFMTGGVEQAKRGGPAAVAWFTQKLNGHLVTIPEYSKMIKAFHAAERKGDAEAKAAGVK